MFGIYLISTDNFHEVQAIHVIGCPRLDYNESTKFYDIQEEDLQHLTSEVDKAKLALEKTLQLKNRGKRSIASVNTEGNEVEGFDRIVGTSRTGRSTTAVNLTASSRKG